MSKSLRNGNPLKWLFVLALTLLPAMAAGANDEYIIRSEVKEVRLAFAVEDRAGKLAHALQPADVAVVDNGDIIRRFRSFHPAAESPLELVILLDTSDSLAARVPVEVAEAKRFIEQSNWGERDRVLILAFGGKDAELTCARRCDEFPTHLKLKTLSAGGMTPLFDALFEALQIMRGVHDVEARPALILFSDGLDTISQRGLDDVTDFAHEMQAAIYSVNSRPAKQGAGPGAQVMNYLASSTGGLSFAPGGNAAESLGAVLKDLHSGYVLTYEVPDGGLIHHAVQMLPTTNPKLSFRCRSEYRDRSQGQ